MAIEFRNVTCAPLTHFSCVVPSGAIVGILGDKSSGAHQLLQLAGGAASPAEGEVIADEPRRLVGPTDPLVLSPVKTLVVQHTFATQDAVMRNRLKVALDRLKDSGTSILIASHETGLLKAFCTEVWWLRDGRLVAAGDPAEVTEWYSHHVSQKLAAWGASLNPPVTAGWYV